MKGLLSRSGLKWPLAAGLLAQTACGGGLLCQPDTSPGPARPDRRGELVSVTSSTRVGVFKADTAVVALTRSGVDTAGWGGKYGIAVHNIVYKTVTPDGRLIDASGVVAYPKRLWCAPSPVLSFQPGTIFTDDDAGSLNANTHNVLKAGAALGFIVVMPDYIGYAASTNEVHTYVHAQGLAAAVVDMLRATRTLLHNKGVATNGQLFLTGYSEGGYATLAAQKEMEQNLAAEFPITASMLAAGPYDMSATAQHMVGLDINKNPQILGFVFKAYDHWHGWNRLDAIFRSPYDNVVATYYDGTKSSGTVKAALTTSMVNLFTPSFRTDFLGSGEAAVKAGFAANDIYNWAPRAPTRLFHGQDDTIVPYFNAVTAHSAMRAAGSSSVTLVDCRTPGIISRDHAECVPNYLSEMLGWFRSLATDL